MPTNGRHTLMSESEYLQRSQEGEEMQPNMKRITTKHSQREKIEKIDKNQQDITKERHLVDRPVPPLENQWVNDPRLPDEMNQLMAMRWSQCWQRQTPTETYRQAKLDEISEPTELLAYLRIEGQKTQKRTEEPKLRLPTVDESMASLEVLRKKYERPMANIKPTTMDRRRDGKEISEKDLLHLRQKWYNEYQEILQGTREQLPPIREINHEINLVDPAMRYKYHLPRCPTALREEFHKKLN